MIGTDRLSDGESIMENSRQLACRNLSKTYGSSKKKALDALNFTLPSHGIFVLIGRNGSGKTTLVRILATELLPTSGEASINGLNVVSEANRLREKIAIVPQDARPIPWMTPLQTVLSYLLWRGFDFRTAKLRALKTFERLGLAEFANVLNRSLSGGMRRKVMVATVLSSEAEIIFLDEPTTGLDPISRQEFWGFLKGIGKERFTFLTTHYLEEAERLADNIGIMDQGNLIRMGTLEELRKHANYEYSIRVLSHLKDLPELATGQMIRGAEGDLRLLTVEDEAFRISKELTKMGAKFTINPMSLDDIFFYLVSRKE